MTLALGFALLQPAAALAQAAPIAPSEVTPRTLRPTPPPAAPAQIDIPQGVPAQAPTGSDKLSVSVTRVEISGGYAELAGRSAAIFRPLEGTRTTIADLYKAAGDLERLYADEGYFLVRVAVPQQSVADGGVFRIEVIDGFFEAVEDSAVPGKLKTPVRRIMAGLTGKKKLRLGDLDARLARLQRIPGAALRSTIAQGETPGGARLILDGGFDPFAATVSADNGLGPTFRDWGLNVQLTANSPFGLGEQIYSFLSGRPEVDDYFRKNSLRRVYGGGIALPLNGRGLEINPEFTASDTRPLASNPLLRSRGKLRRGSLNLRSPLPIGETGATEGRLTFELVDESQNFPAFATTISHDHLAVLRGNVGWDGAWGAAGVHLDATLSQGLSVFGMGKAQTDGPVSRDADLHFTKLEALMSVSRSVFSTALFNVTLRAQTAFGEVVPSSETFAPTGQDALSSFTSGALSSDAGVTGRVQLEQPFNQKSGRVGFSETPYVFIAAGRVWPSDSTDSSPRRALAYGSGLKLSMSNGPFGIAPFATIEYGRADPSRGASDDRIQVSLGVSF